MPPLRYFILARNGSDLVELFKLEQAPETIVIASSLIPSMVETGNIHVTHHAPKGGMSTRIVHISDARGTDVRRFLDPAAHVVDLIRIGVNLADIDWDKAKKFTKKSYAERVVLDVGAHGESIDVQFLMGTPRLVKATLEMRRESPDSVGMIIMRPGIVGGPPKGHLVNYSEIVFDDEADVTLGSLVLQCHTPEGPLQGIPPGTEGFVVYGMGGELVRRIVESEPT